MMRLITPLILIIISAAVFFIFATPLWRDIGELRAESASYDQALENSTALENERDKLTAKYNSMNPDDLSRLEKMLPESVDNIRLILEIEQVASSYGMVLRDVKYNTDNGEASAQVSPVPRATPSGVISQKDYGVWELEFSTNGSYANFTNFLKALERNLRVVDVSSIEFSSNLGTIPNPSQNDSYKYNFKVKTYWLKN